MKFLDRLEKSKTFWFLLIASFFFFLLRLPSLFEPYWYGDEGVYDVLGAAINQGRLLYRDIWDNKPPLLYYVYALLHSNQTAVRSASLIVGLLCIIVFFFLAKKLLDKQKTVYIATGLFAFLFATPFVEGNIANAENFMMLPILFAGLCTILLAKKWHAHVMLFSAGLLLGIAFLFKVVAVFDFAAFMVFVFIVSFHRWKEIPRQIATLVLMVVGFFLPLVLTMLFFIFHHALGDFIHSAFTSNVGYVNYGNQFLIPQGLLIFKLLLLGGFILWLLFRRTHFSQGQLFILIWTAFSLFNALFSQRPYTHYVLVLIASFSLLVGLLFEKKQRKYIYAVSVIIVLLIVAKNFTFSLLGFGYYPNFIEFLIGKKTVLQYQAFFDSKTPRDYAIAEFINMQKKPGETIYIWGNNAQVYTLTHTLPPGRYTVAYHAAANKTTLQETYMSIAAANPRFIIVMPSQPILPYPLIQYHQRLSIEGATIYERNL